MPAHPTLFEDIDSMVPEAFSNHLSDDVSFVFGNGAVQTTLGSAIKTLESPNGGAACDPTATNLEAEGPMVPRSAPMMEYDITRAA